MKRLLAIVLPLAIVALSAVGAGMMILSREKPETRVPEVAAPVVRVQPVELQDVQLTVRSQGTVSPRTESTLVPQVSGQVIEVAPSFVAGGFFEEGDLLVRIDAHDYRQALVQARARVVQAQLRVANEEAEAEVARREWAELGDGEATPLTRRELQVADAEAALAAARAAVEQAQRNLERTELRAPFAGRVRNKRVDVGQFVTLGSPLGTIYAVDYAEVRLPLPDEDLAFLDLPLVYRGEHAGSTGPRVRLHARFAGREHEWDGRIVRTEGEIDPRTRMVHAVAEVKDPYGRGDDPDRPPLAAGLFVEAEIFGDRVDGVAVIPRSVVRDGNRVLLVDDEDKLRFREIEVLRHEQDSVIVIAGLSQGERICTSLLAAVTDGMRVRPEEAP